MLRLRASLIAYKETAERIEEGIIGLDVPVKVMPTEALVQQQMELSVGSFSLQSSLQ